MANPLYQKHIISINDLSRDDLNLVLATAAKLKANPQPELLKHKVIASCFFEASTRTRLSFETSMHRLGASVVGFSDSAKALNILTVPCDGFGCPGFTRFSTCVSHDMILRSLPAFRKLAESYGLKPQE